MSLENLKTKLLSDPKVKAHYEEIKPEFEAACAIIDIRRKLVIRNRTYAETGFLNEKSGFHPQN